MSPRQITSKVIYIRQCGEKLIRRRKPRIPGYSTIILVDQNNSDEWQFFSSKLLVRCGEDVDVALRKSSVFDAGWEMKANGILNDRKLAIKILMNCCRRAHPQLTFFLTSNSVTVCKIARGIVVWALFGMSFNKDKKFWFELKHVAVKITLKTICNKIVQFDYK